MGLIYERARASHLRLVGIH